MAQPCGAPYSGLVPPPWPTPEGHVAVSSPQCPSSWATDVAAAALTRGTVATTVTYGRTCADFMALTMADLEMSLAALNFTTAVERGPGAGC